MQAFALTDLGFVAALKGTTAGSYVSAPVTTEETAATRIFSVGGWASFSTAKASAGATKYNYNASAAGQVYYEEQFTAGPAGTVSIYGYLNSDGAPFRVFIDGLQVATGTYAGSTSSPVLVATVTGIGPGLHTIRVAKWSANTTPGGTDSFFQSDKHVYA